jgi:hypothetical protein
VERWQQIESLFQEALERNPAERNAWLQEACQGDSDLQREVASLLANHQAATDSKSWALGRACGGKIDRQAHLSGARPVPGTWLKTIHAMWPECPARINEAGTHFGVRPAVALHGRGDSNVCA